MSLSLSSGEAMTAGRVQLSLAVNGPYQGRTLVTKAANPLTERH